MATAQRIVGAILAWPVTIPTFTGCGAATAVVDAAIAGSGNTYSIALSDARRGTIQE